MSKRALYVCGCFIVGAAGYAGHTTLLPVDVTALLSAIGGWMLGYGGTKNTRPQ